MSGCVNHLKLPIVAGDDLAVADKLIGDEPGVDAFATADVGLRRPVAASRRTVPHERPRMPESVRTDALARSRASGEWSRWVWVTMIWLMCWSGPTASRIACRWECAAGPGSITAMPRVPEDRYWSRDRSWARGCRPRCGAGLAPAFRQVRWRGQSRLGAAWFGLSLGQGAG